MDIEVTVMIIHAEVVPNCIKDATREALHNIVTPALITTAMTCHTRRSSSRRSLSTHSRDLAGRSHTSYKPNKNTSSKSSSSSSRTTVKPQDKKQERVMIDDPKSDYFSSDDSSRDSEDDLN